LENFASKHIVFINRKFSITLSSAVHVFYPDQHGGVEKEGRSSGLATTLALISLGRDRSLSNFAMTGEVTLTGRVIAVSGAREKVMAAFDNNIRTFILPRHNFQEARYHSHKLIFSSSL
jgi:ATP-dependent Lon protease